MKRARFPTRKILVVITKTRKRILKASTGDLTTKGFSIYLEQIYAYGASLGVQFGVSERMFSGSGKRRRKNARSCVRLQKWAALFVSAWGTQGHQHKSIMSERGTDGDGQATRRSSRCAWSITLERQAFTAWDVISLRRCTAFRK